MPYNKDKLKKCFDEGKKGGERHQGLSLAEEEFRILKARTKELLDKIRKELEKE